MATPSVIWLLARGEAGWPIATYSVLIDRVVGVSVLAFLVVACLPWTLSLVHDPIARVALVMIGFGALAAALAFLAVGVFAGDGTMEAHPSPRHCFPAGVAVMPISYGIASRGVVVCYSSDVGDCRVGQCHGRKRLGRLCAHLVSVPACAPDRDRTALDSRVGRARKRDGTRLFLRWPSGE